ncbi:MAG: ribonuclease III [Clostridia bacterium]|jgi:ribonuclease-3|nr:ribonuclease III [Clostridia bacterium]
MNLSNFENSIGYSFKNKDLLREALTHTSYAYANKVKSNERLEYLGDSILEFIISEYLFLEYKKLSEGEMTKVRANVVCEDSLFEIAQRHNFSDFLYLGKSEQHSQNSKKALMADSVEAVIAAIFLDSNLENSRKFILENLKDTVRIASKNVGMKDYKTVLQEKLQINGEVKIQYNVIREEGPDHDKTFIVEVSCDGKVLAEGRGKNKKNAEMEAAKVALQCI